jgi:hypothetical protein
MSVVIFPIFRECKKFTLDTFWQEMFEGFSVNRFPNGLKYDPVKHALRVKVMNKKTSEIVPLTDKPYEVFQTVMKTVKDKLGKRSNRDMQDQQDNLDNICRERALELNCPWKKIKSRYVKEQLLLNFINDLREKYNLSPSEVSKATSIIGLGFQFKELTNDGVVCEDGKILSIEGLEFDEEARQFKTTPTKHVTLKPEKITVPNKFYRALDKYIKDYQLRSFAVTSG